MHLLRVWAVIVTRDTRAVSNAVPADPVVCTKTGHVFERTLIEKYLDEMGKCPISGQEMTKDDLLPLKMGKPIKPRHTPAMSIPGILGMLHNVSSSLPAHYVPLEYP